ncbi:MAG: TldD/PmbA family protein [Nitrospira sp.]|nr:TldD/PmbA family protein [Nitrospira sp.]
MDISIDTAQQLLEKAKKRGATDGDILLIEGRTSSVIIRLSEIEKITDSNYKALGLRLFFGKSCAITSTSDMSPENLERLMEDTCRIAKLTAKDEFAGLPEPQQQTVTHIKDIAIYDEHVHDLSVEEMIRLAKEAEAASLNFDKRITNSEGGYCSKRYSRLIYAGTNGSSGTYESSMFSLSATPIASQDGSMQRDSWYSSKRKFSQLDSPASIGELAAMRTVRRLGGKKINTCQAPVVFDSETASDLIGSLCSAISGYSIYKGSSFLLGMLNKQIASTNITIYDDGTIPWGLGSKPFDGEGTATGKTSVIENGVLKSYLLDSYSARKLNLTTTGNASRSTGSPPVVSPTNFYLTPGDCSPSEIIKSVDSGLYVTELIGFGFNPVTGDYSRGAVGIWIENGELTYPVEEITIAGNFKDMLMQIEMVGSDLDLRQKVCAPTIKIGRLTIAGN